MTSLLARGLPLLLAPVLAAQTGTIEGSVVDRVTRTPIPGVSVELRSVGTQSFADKTLTDATGGFRIDCLPPGDYFASFDKDGWGSAVLSSSQSVVRLGLAAPARVSVALTRLASLSGHVTAPDGKPIPHIRVQLVSASQTAHMVLLVGGDTDRDGRFEMSGLWPGTYLLQAQPAGFGVMASVGALGLRNKDDGASRAAPPTAPEGERRTWAPTFYPDVVDRREAPRIVVHAGWDMTGYDIRLQAVPAYRLGGIVLGPDGRPLARVALSLDPADRSSYEPDSAISREDGSFEFPAVHRGEWLVAAECAGCTPEARGSADISMTRHDLENVVVRLAPGFALAGFVEGELPLHPDGTPDEDTISLEPAAGRVNVNATRQGGGRILFQGVYPGRYRVGVNGTARGYYVESVQLGGRNILDQDVELTPVSPPVRVVYRRATGGARGTVADGPRAKVFLVPADEALLFDPYIASVNCDGDGRYELTAVRRGSYYAFAFAHADRNAFEDYDFVRGLVPSATRVEIENGRTAALDLKLTSWPE